MMPQTGEARAAKQSHASACHTVPDLAGCLDLAPPANEAHANCRRTPWHAEAWDYFAGVAGWITGVPPTPGAGTAFSVGTPGCVGIPFAGAPSFGGAPFGRTAPGGTAPGGTAFGGNVFGGTAVGGRPFCGARFGGIAG